MADYAAQYVYILTPFLYFYFIGIIYQSFSNSQEVTWYAFAAVIVGLVSFVLFICLFYFYFDMGYKGLLLANGLMYFLRFVTNYALVKGCNDIKSQDDVYLFSRETVTNLCPLIQKGFYSVFLFSWSAWSLSIFTLITTYISPKATAAHSIMRHITLVPFTIPSGLATGASINIGISIGQQNKSLAMQYYRVALGIGILITTFEIFSLCALQNPIITAFTSDAEIAKKIQSTWPALCANIFFSSVSSVGVGFIRGSGKLKSGLCINFVAYWLIGVPLGYFLTLHLNFGNSGVWIGFAMAMVSSSAFYEIFISFLNWP